MTSFLALLNWIDAYGINPTSLTKNEKYDVTGCHHTIYGKKYSKLILNGPKINQIHTYTFSIIELPLIGTEG